MRLIAGTLIVLLIVLSWAAASEAQDSQEFVLTVPDAISIRSPGDVVISHDRSNNNQVFPDQIWDVYTTNQTGATVTLSMDRFVHENFFFFRRNARIRLRVVDSDASANWTTIVDDDRTTGFFGPSTATVSAESFGAGAGRLGIRVSFLEFNGQFLAGGNYISTVVGQITNK